MASYGGPMFDPDDEDDPLADRGRRPPRRGIDINDLPVWTWVAILLIVVVIGAGLWLMTRNDEGAGPQAGVSGTVAPGTPGAPAVGGITPTPVIVGNTPTPLPPKELAIGVRAAVTGTGASQLRVRSGPGTDNSTLVIIPDDTEVKVVEGPQAEGERTWWRIELKDGTVGWTVQDYLRPIGR